MTKPIGLSHVRYEEGDRLGELLAWTSLLPVLVMLGAFPALLIFRRDLQTVNLMAGMAFNEGLNAILKGSFRVPRPRSCAAVHACQSYGWPSNHAQWMGFFCVYMSLSVLYRFQFADERIRLLSPFLIWPIGLLTMWSRSYLGYHSVDQVLAGGVVGGAAALFWYKLSGWIIIPLFPKIENLSICKYLYVKDCTHVPNLLKFEYDNVRNLRAARETAEQQYNWLPGGREAAQRSRDRDQQRHHPQQQQNLPRMRRSN